MIAKLGARPGNKMKHHETKVKDRACGLKDALSYQSKPSITWELTRGRCP